MSIQLLREAGIPYNSLVSLGKIYGVEPVNKFGRNNDIDTGSVPEDIWSQGGVYTFLSSPAQMFISSSDAGADQQIEVQGLDENWNIKTEVGILNGQNQVALPGTFLRVFRAKNRSSTELGGDVYVAETDSLSGGVPDDATKIKAKIDEDEGQTLMSIYSVPEGYKALVQLIESEIVDSGGQAQSARISFQVRNFGESFRTLETLNPVSTGNSSAKKQYIAPDLLEPKTDIRMRVQDVTSNNELIKGSFSLLLYLESMIDQV